MRTAIDASPVSAVTRVPGDTDQDLIAAVRAGDDAAFAALYRRYHRRIAAYIFGMVKDYGRAEDIAQEVFLSALRRMRATDRPIAFKPWLYEIAKNACIDQFRRSSRGEEVSYDAEGGLGAADHGRLVVTGPSPDAAVDQKMSLDHLCSAFGGLSEVHHEILVMRELEGLSYREIGERLGMTRPAVESTLFRARRRLAEEYEDLVSGQRCLRVQSIIAATATGALGARDRRRMAAHVSHCQPCRRHARRAGVAPELLQDPRPVRARIAALLPIPAFLRRRVEDSGGAGASSHATTAAQWSTQLSALGDPAVAGWTKAVVAAATVAIAGLGAGAATHLDRGDGGSSARPAAAGHTHVAPRPAGVARTARTPAVPAARPASASTRPAPSGRTTVRPRATTGTRRLPATTSTAAATTRPVTTGTLTDAVSPTTAVRDVTAPVGAHRRLVDRTVSTAASTVSGILKGDTSATTAADPVVTDVTQAVSGAADAVTGIVTGG